jgi:hypothetical protein
MLGPGQGEVFAEDFQESLVRRERDLDRLAVEQESDVRFRPIGRRKIASALHSGRV